MNVIIKNEASDVASSVDEKIRWIGGTGVRRL
jgi:hypothetical protein